MDSTEAMNAESHEFQQARPNFYIGQHDSARTQAPTEEQYGQVLNAGFNFMTTPITNRHFYQRIADLYQSYREERQSWSDVRGFSAGQLANASLPPPIVPTLTDKDTTLLPSTYVGSLVAYVSPWIDLGSPDPGIASISRQVLNLEVGYANFCGVRSVIVPGPRRDGDPREVARISRAVHETLLVATRANIIVHMSMYREPGLEEEVELLSDMFGDKPDESASSSGDDEIELFSAWDTWHTLRSFCNYSVRLFVALRMPRRLPERDLQDRWFSEPLHYLTFGSKTFQENRTGNPSLSKFHQDMINRYMRLKSAPWILLHDIETDLQALADRADAASREFPTLSEAQQALKENQRPDAAPIHAHVAYMRHLERLQAPYSALESTTLVNFQDWLQSPLQPLSDNLESATYEIFEGDPVKYDQYEIAIRKAMEEWNALGKPASGLSHDGQTEQPELVVTVAGAGRGPLVSRALRAAQQTGTRIQLWALEKNQNAYVYLLRQNESEWAGRVTVVKTDMRGWEGPRARGPGGAITKVDILITELLGSFGDNELSPECLDGIQRHVARPHGISIPASYTAHVSPISTPRLFADISSRITSDPNAFDTPWVVRLFALDFVARDVGARRRFQQAWEFAHPVEVARQDDYFSGVGSMSGAFGRNEHNLRHCHLTFVCPVQGVIHGLGGYFESVLYVPQGQGEDKVEISTLPDQIDRKSRDMISWFPIFFPLRQPLYFPRDSELEVSMWRQTDDTKVWYEWVVEAFAWVGPNSRIKVGASELQSSRRVACLM